MKWKHAILALVGVAMWGMIPNIKAGPVVDAPPSDGGGGGGGGSLISNVSTQSRHQDTRGWGSLNGSGLIVSEMSGSIYINPDNNPNDNVIASFSAIVNMSGDFADSPDDFPEGNQGPSVNGQSSIYEYSLIHSDQGWDYVQGVPSFSLGYYANTNYFINNRGKPGGDTQPELWTNINSNFDVMSGQITNSWSDFSQNFWSGGEPMPDWFTLFDWSGSIGVSGVIVPEPASLVLLGGGVVAMICRKRRPERHKLNKIS